MILADGNQSTQRKIFPGASCRPQVSQWMSRARIRAAVVRGLRHGIIPKKSSKLHKKNSVPVSQYIGHVYYKDWPLRIEVIYVLIYSVSWVLIRFIIFNNQQNDLHCFFLYFNHICLNNMFRSLLHTFSWWNYHKNTKVQIWLVVSSSLRNN